MRSRSLVDRFWTAPRPTWWLVRTRPSGETNEPEAPPNEIEASRRWSMNSGVTVKPYFFCRMSLGGLLNSHMPSSEDAGRTRTTARRAARANRRDLAWFMGMVSFPDVRVDIMTHPERNFHGRAFTFRARIPIILVGIKSRTKDGP